MNALTFIPLSSAKSETVGKDWLAAIALHPLSNKTAFTEEVPTSKPRIKLDMTDVYDVYLELFSYRNAKVLTAAFMWLKEFRASLLLRWNLLL